MVNQKYNSSVAFDLVGNKSNCKFCDFTITHNSTREADHVRTCTSMPDHVRQQFMTRKTAPLSTYPRPSNSQPFALVTGEASSSFPHENPLSLSNVTAAVPESGDADERDVAADHVTASQLSAPCRADDMQAEDFMKRVPFEGKCKDCTLSFDTPATLLAHFPCFLKTEFYQKSGSGEVTFVCPLKAGAQPCDRTFPKIEALRNHMRYKLEKLFMCTMCGSKFATKQHTERHIEGHQGLRPHVCPDCSVSYSDSRSLQSHQEKTGHGSECVVESVEFFEQHEDEASGEPNESEDSEDEFSPSDDPDNDPDFTADSRQVSHRTNSSRNSCRTITGSPDFPNSPASAYRSGSEPPVPMRFPVKRGRGRPRKHPYPNSDDRRQLCLAVPSPDPGLLPVVRRGPGRPRKNQNPYISTSSRPPVYLDRKFSAPLKTLSVTAAVATTAPQPTVPLPEPLPATPMSTTADPSMSDRIAMISSIKHCAACNAMFFQQVDFDRHFTSHGGAVVEKVTVGSQTWDEAVSDPKSVNNLPGSNSEQQDSSDSFADAVASIPFQEMDSHQSDFPDLD